MIGDIAAGIPDWLVFDVLGFLARAQLQTAHPRESVCRVEGLPGRDCTFRWSVARSALLYGVFSAPTKPPIPGWGVLIWALAWFGCFQTWDFFQTINFVLGSLSRRTGLLAFTRVGAWAGVLALAFCGIAFVIWVNFFEWLA